MSRIADDARCSKCVFMGSNPVDRMMFFGISKNGTEWVQEGLKGRDTNRMLIKMRMKRMTPKHELWEGVGLR